MIERIGRSESAGAGVDTRFRVKVSAVTAGIGFAIAKALAAEGAQVIVHGHCHQKSLFGMQGDTALLERLGVQWKLLDTGCCGMAGSFGFNEAHYAMSEKIGEDKLFPAVRAAFWGLIDRPS